MVSKLSIVKSNYKIGLMGLMEVAGVCLKVWNSKMEVKKIVGILETIPKLHWALAPSFHLGFYYICPMIHSHRKISVYRSLILQTVPLLGILVPFCFIEVDKDTFFSICQILIACLAFLCLT